MGKRKSSEPLKAKPVSRLVWKEGKVFAVETEKAVWCLGQLLFEPYVAFFDRFSKGGKFTAADWKDAEVLFVHGVTRQFFSDSAVEQLTAVPKKDIQIQKIEINDAILDRCEDVTLWKGTNRERRINVERSGSLVRRFPTKPLKRSWPQAKDILVSEVPLDDSETIDAYPMAGLEEYPLLNWRLYLCYTNKANVDPFKELTFRRKLPATYQKFINYVWPENDF